MFLATDGAANWLAAAGIHPHIVLGDFDSLADESRSSLPSAEFVCAADQEASDLDKAIEHVIGRGAQRITITGASGGRADHSLTAISLLLKYGAAVDVRVVEDSGELSLLLSEVVVEGERGDTVSLVVFDSVHGITTDGLAWPLADESLHPGSRGVSNRLTGTTGRISIREGRAIVCHLRQSPKS
jgi:thiamine pyrophosphokinase